MSEPQLPTLARPSYFDGQRLVASDLEAAQRLQQEMRWLHNRSLHGWGIAAGLAVTGSRGEKIVQIRPGLALDVEGRELILDAGRTMSVPAIAGGRDGREVLYYLTISYADLPEPADTRAGICGSSGAVRRPEVARLRWQAQADVDPETRYRPGLDVVLCTIAVQNCRLAADVSLTERRSALAQAQRPRIAAGHTPPGGTPWRLWPGQFALGVATTVRTASGGFKGVPHYQAHVVGERIFATWTGTAYWPAAVDGTVQIVGETPTSFELHVTLAGGIFAGAGVNHEYWLNPNEVLTSQFMDRLRGELGWYVVWMGVEG